MGAFIQLIETEFSVAVFDKDLEAKIFISNYTILLTKILNPQWSDSRYFIFFQQKDNQKI